MADNYGLSKTVPNHVYLLDSATQDVLVGDMLTTSGATTGYIQRVDAASEAVMGFAVQKVSSPSADGDSGVLVDLSKEHIYMFPPDAGTVSQALVGTLLDSGADGRSVKIATTATNDLRCVGVDLAANVLYVQRA